MSEEWREIPGFPSYIVSATGRVARLLKGKQSYGYVLYELSSSKRMRKSMFAARAVALAFIGPPPSPRMDASHLDGNRKNNTVDNIAWKSRKDNMADKRRHGTQPFGETSHLAKIDRVVAQAMRAMWARGGVTKKEIAENFGVSRATVRRVIDKVKTGGGWNQ